MKRLVFGIIGVLVFLILVLSPLFVLLIAPTPPGRSFWVAVSIALAYAGFAMVGMQLLLTARFRRFSAPYGIDTVYYFHRETSIVAAVLILAHPIILFITIPATLALLNPVVAPWRATAGLLALLLLLALIITSQWRMPLRLTYEPWRIIHGLCAIAAILLAFAHIVGTGYYLGVPWKQGLWIGLGAIWIGALLYMRLIRPFLVYARPYTVAKVIQERGRSWTLALTPDGHPGMRFRPGQFAWLSIGVSPFALHEHPFSFSSSAEHPKRLCFTIKELGDFTERIGAVAPGTRVYVDGPFGGFSHERYPAPACLFVAGGIGITPIMSMLRTMDERRDPRPLVLIYANRTWDGATFREELARLETRLALRVIHVLEEAPEGWEGEVGFVTRDLLARALPERPREAEYFICGPPPMMDIAEHSLHALGIPDARLHVERFNLV